MAAGMTMDDNLRASSWQLTGEKCNKFQREKCKMRVGNWATIGASPRSRGDNPHNGNNANAKMRARARAEIRVFCMNKIQQ